MRTLKDLLLMPATELGRAGRFLVFQYKLWAHCFRLLNKNRAEQLAAALSYYTIFGMVPLAIVAVLIFNSIPAYRDTGEQLKKLIYEELRLTRIEYPDPDNPDEAPRPDELSRRNRRPLLREHQQGLAGTDQRHPGDLGGAAPAVPDRDRIQPHVVCAQGATVHSSGHQLLGPADARPAAAGGRPVRHDPIHDP